MATKIYIDQGHNPVNPNAGAEGSGYREQDLVFRIGILLSQILESDGYETRLSRPTAQTQLGTSNLSSLQRRVNEANRWGADYFITLHTNAAENSAATGSEALVYSIPSRASRLGESILRELTELTGLRNRGVIARPGLYVLRKTIMPAVLLELGFISNPSDAAQMANEPELFAEGIAKGIVAYLDTVPAGKPAGEAVAAAALPEVRYEPLSDSPPANDEEEREKQALLPDYKQFLLENPCFGELKVQAYRGFQALPVPDVNITVYKVFRDGHRVLFSGKTDPSGLIESIRLPAPPRGNSLTPAENVKAAVVQLHAEAAGYVSQDQTVEIFENMRTIQPLQMMLKEE